MHKRPHLFPQAPHSAPRSSAGWISAWSVSAISISSALQACALYLFLVTVADAQGLSYYADPSLCQRLSMTGTELHQARQALITLGLVAYQRPLYQVLALDAAPRGAATSAATVAADDEPMDLKAVFAAHLGGVVMIDYHRLLPDQTPP